jgi:hypothetical protein
VSEPSRVRRHWGDRQVVALVEQKLGNVTAEHFASIDGQLRIQLSEMGEQHRDRVPHGRQRIGQTQRSGLTTGRGFDSASSAVGS